MPGKLGLECVGTTGLLLAPCPALAGFLVRCQAKNGTRSWSDHARNPGTVTVHLFR